MNTSRQRYSPRFVTYAALGLLLIDLAGWLEALAGPVRAVVQALTPAAGPLVAR